MNSHSIKTLIVDDEPIAREGLRIRLAEFDDIEIVGECGNGSDAIKTLLNNNVDLVFLDIKMPKLSGFDVVNAVGSEQMPQVIFLTAYDQYAIEAFEVNALDYLLKPVTQERLSESVQRARNNRQENQLQQHAAQLTQLLKQVQTSKDKDAPTSRIVIRNHGQVHFVDPEDILWVEADGDYIQIHTEQRSHLLRETLSNIEQRLANQGFQRIHRSAIVRLSAIDRLQTTDSGDYVAILHNGASIKVSRSHKEGLFNSLELAE